MHIKSSLLLICCLAIGPNWAIAQDKAPPKELIQYVQDATKLGLKDQQIQQNAVKAGWPSATVSQAIKHVRESMAVEVETAGAKSDGPAVPEPIGPRPPNTHPPVDIIPGTNPPSAAAQSEQPADREVAETYLIGAGDVLQISVWKEPDVSVPNTVVRPDGKITMPLLKEVSVVGLSPAEAEKLITGKLSQLIPEANVTVVVTEINSKKIYVIGGVKKEGPIPYTYRMTIMQALSEAGGLSDYAKRKNIYVLRSQNGKQYRLPFNYDAALKGEQMELNVQLLPGDTLVVPR